MNACTSNDHLKNRQQFKISPGYEVGWYLIKFTEKPFRALHDLFTQTNKFKHQ